MLGGRSPGLLQLLLSLGRGRALAVDVEQRTPQICRMPLLCGRGGCTLLLQLVSEVLISTES
jgi:hypothetical protein